MIRYQELRIGLDNQGVGDFSLASRAYNERQTEHTVQTHETATLSPQAINETRFQYLRSRSGRARATIHADDQRAGRVLRRRRDDRETPAWSRTTGRLTNIIDLHERQPHVEVGRARDDSRGLADTSLPNFAGTFTFLHTGAVPEDDRVAAGRLHRRADCATGRGTCAIQAERRNPRLQGKPDRCRPVRK